MESLKEKIIERIKILKEKKRKNKFNLMELDMDKNGDLQIIIQKSREIFEAEIIIAEYTKLLTKQ